MIRSLRTIWRGWHAGRIRRRIQRQILRDHLAGLHLALHPACAACEESPSTREGDPQDDAL